MPTLRHLAVPLSEIAHKVTTFYPPDQKFFNLIFCIAKGKIQIKSATAKTLVVKRQYKKTEQ